MEDPIQSLYAIISVIIVLAVAGAAFGALNDLASQPYKDTIKQKDINIEGLNTQLNVTNNLLVICKEEYSRLITENITKKDIEEIKGYYNLTQIQINNLDQKFETASTNYYNIYNVILNQYQISLAINLFFVLDLFSFAIFKNEIIFFALGKAKKKIRKLKEKKHANV